MQVEVGDSIVVRDENNISLFHYPVRPDHVTRLSARLGKDSVADIRSDGDVSVETEGSLRINSESVSVAGLQHGTARAFWGLLCRRQDAAILLFCAISLLFMFFAIGYVAYDVKVREPYVCRDGYLFERIKGGILQDKQAKCVYED